MPEALYLADTSAWILALRKGQTKQSWIEEFKTLLMQRRIAIAYPIRLELLTGSRTAQEYQELADELDALTVLEITPEIWKESARLGFTLRQKGITLPTLDIVIAAAAIFYNCVLTHSDHHYGLIARHTPLKTQFIAQK